MASRVRVQGDLWHGRVPEGAIYVGRAAPGLKASPYRNPFTVRKHGPEALRLFADHLDRNPDLVARARQDLAGKDLACWCPLGSPCHADEWLRRIESKDDLGEPMPDDAAFRCTTCDWRGECRNLNDAGDCPQCGEPAEPL
jgi:hypothetical protein